MKSFVTIAIAMAIFCASDVSLGQGKGNSKPPPLQPLAYYDASGQLVGRLVTAPSYQAVVPWGLDFVYLRVDDFRMPDDTVETWFVHDGGLRYTGGSCTGTAYINGAIGAGIPGASPRLRALIKMPAGSILYVTPPAYPKLQVTYASEMDSTGYCYTLPTATTGQAYAIEGTLNLSQQFLRPLSLR